MLFSRFESDFLGIKIGRYSGIDLDISLIKKAMDEEKLDVCRIKVSASNLTVNHQLKKLNLPLYFGGGIANYIMHTADINPGPFLNDGIEFKKVLSEDAEVLENLIKQAFLADPMGYYKIPGIEKYFDKKEEAACLAAWHVNLIDSPDHSMYLSKIKDEYNGFISIYKDSEQSVTTPIAGVLPSCRRKDIFHDLVVYRQRYCQKNKLNFGLQGARLANFYSQKVFIDEGVKPVNIDLIYYVTRVGF